MFEAKSFSKFGKSLNSWKTLCQEQGMRVETERERRESWASGGERGTGGWKGTAAGMEEEG